MGQAEKNLPKKIEGVLTNRYKDNIIIEMVKSWK